MKTHFFIFFIISILLCSCNSKVITAGIVLYTEKVYPWPDSKAYKVNVHYIYEHNGIKYEGESLSYRSQYNYMKYDSVYVVINKKKPEQSSLNGIKRRFSDWGEYHTLSTDKNNVAKESVQTLSYHDAAKKPLFFMAETPEENKKKIEEYLINEKNKDNFSITGRNLFIIFLNEDGSIEKITMSGLYNKKTVDYIERKIKATPPWQPGYNSRN